MWNENQFSDFYFSCYGIFCTQIMVNFNDNSKNKSRKNRKIYFSFDSAHCKSFTKIGAKLRGGVCISLVWKYLNLFIFHGHNSKTDCDCVTEEFCRKNNYRYIIIDIFYIGVSILQ